MEEVHMAMDVVEPTETKQVRRNLKKKLMESTVLNSFTQLASERECIRTSAGVALLKHLAISNEDQRENERTYALDRLVRGVGSSRKYAKTGFYSALVALLAKTNDITTENVLDLVKTHLNTSLSKCSKGENSDICMGQILVCGALIRSNKFMDSSFEEQKQIVEMLFTAGNKKSLLSLGAFLFVFEVVEKINEEQFKNVWEIIKPEVAKPWKEQNVDTLYLLCLARDKFPGVVKSKFFKKNLEVPEIIHEDSIKELCGLMMSPFRSAKNNHPIDSYISKKIAQSNLTPKWCAEMDSQLLKMTQKKVLLAISIFTTILENLVDHTQIPDVLTPQFTISIIHNFKSKRLNDQDPEFLARIDKFFLSLTKTLASESVTSKTKVVVLKKLLFYPGTFIFEKITRSKLVQHITASLDADGIKKVSKLYREVVLGSKPKVISDTQTENWINLDRIYASSLLIKLLNSKAVQKDAEWRLEQIKFLLKLGLFKDTDDCRVGAELATSLKEGFYHSLDQKLPKLEDLRSLLSSIVHFIDETIFTENTNELRTPLPENGPEIWAEMMDLIKKLESQQKPNFVVFVFHTLLLQMGLLLFKDFEMAQNALKELHTCYNKVQSQKKTKKGKEEPEHKSQKTLDIDSTEPEWIEVVVDLFLSLLSYNSHFLRNIISCVFPFLCPHLTMHALRQILDVLDPKNENNPLVKSRHESSDEDWSSDEDDLETDVAKPVEEVEESYTESEDSDPEEDQNDEEESSMDKLRMAVRSVLHKQGYKTDDESEDIDKMDVEVGRQLDTALSAAFKLLKKSPKGKKKNQTRDDKTLTHFRVRVLDLIEQYLDSEPSMSQTLEIATLLLQTLEFSVRDVHQKPLESRVRSTLRKLANIKKFSALDMTEVSLAETLNAFLDKGSKSAFIYQDMADPISDCCIFVLKCFQIIQLAGGTPKKSKKKPSKLEQIFQNSLEVYFKNRDCLIPLVLFKNVIQVSWEGNWSLVPLLVNFAFDSEVRPFRKSQALELLKLFYMNKRFRIENLDQFKLKIAPIETELSRKSIENMNDLIQNLTQSKIREKSFSSLLMLLTSVKMADASENMDWTTLGKVVQTYRSHVSLAKDAKLAYNKFCQVLHLNPAVKMQNTKVNGMAEQNGDHLVEEEGTIETDKKRKKIAKNDRQKMKKEATLLRMKASAEGLENEIAFSAVSLAEIKAQGEDISETDESTEEMIKGKSKTKLKRKTKQLHKVSNDSSDEEEETTKVKKIKTKLKRKQKQQNISNGSKDEDGADNEMDQEVNQQKVKKMKKKSKTENTVQINGQLENGSKKQKKRYNSESDERPKKQKKTK